MGDRDDVPVGVPKVKLDDLVDAVFDLADAYRGLAGKVVDEGVRARIVRDAIYCLDDSRMEAGLTQTVRQLEGRPMTEKIATRLAWQIVARQEDLWRGPIVWLDVPSSNGWVALEALGTADAEWIDGSDAQTLHLFCLSGTPAGFDLHRKVPERWLNGLAYKIGWNRRVEYPREPKRFIGMRFWAFVVTRAGGELDLQSWATDARILAENRRIIGARQRFELDRLHNPRTGAPVCPFEFDHDCQDCTKEPHECPATYRRRH